MGTRLPWFRLYTEARTDLKLSSLPDDEFRVWFRLLCYAAEQDVRGCIPYADDDPVLAIEVACGDSELMSRAVTTMSRLRLVTVDDGYLVFDAFADRQYDNPSDMPERTRERKRRQRARSDGGA